MLKEKFRKVLIRPVVFMGVAFAVWLFCFRGYFLGQLGFTSDAISYSDHICFFLKNLRQGHFSLWDPYWSGGVPNSFFLLRICPYNPFYLFVIFLQAIGVPQHFAYIFFLAAYLFFGMAGFYLLCKRLTGDEASALLAFAVLLFSALSTRIFDSYMIFIVTPLAWFFYFLARHSTSPDRRSALGVTFFTIILVTTYIPFYFLTIFLSFLLVFMIVYSNNFISAIKNIFVFISRDRWMAAFCAVAILLSALPGALFFLEAGRGGISIPGRPASTTESHALAVQSQAEESWAVPEEFYFSVYYHDLKRITFAIVYVPCFAFILLVIGAGLRISRLMVFLAVWGALILLLTSPFASPLYSFLRAKLFFLKYFRNLHFLLWFILLPAFALFVGELFRSFRDGADRKPGRWLVSWVVTAHVLLLAIAFWQPYVLLTTKITITFSAIFLACYLLVPVLRKRNALVAGTLLFLVLLQPLEVYYYFSKNVPAGTGGGFYDDLRRGYHYTMHVVGEGKKEGDFPNEIGQALTNGSYSDKPSGPLYFATKYYNDLRAVIPMSLVATNESSRFIAYDQVELENGRVNWGGITQAWQKNENKALIEAGYPGPKVIGDIRASQPMVFVGASEAFKIVKGSTDSVTLDVNFSSAKLLVFNDSFHPDWRVKVNGRSERVWRVNGAFKGVVVPAGSARVVFTFGSLVQRLLNGLLVAVFYGIAAALCVLVLRQRREGTSVGSA